MIMAWIWTVILVISIVFSIFSGNGKNLSTSVLAGAQSGIQLSLSIAGSVCLWSGVGHLMEKTGLTEKLSGAIKPFLFILFPTCRRDAVLRGALSGNICANLLGLGNAATPMGIQAARRLSDPLKPGRATDELCRLIVLNTASIQLLPTNVAAVRASCGAASAFDILPAVWITSFCSAALGLISAWIAGKIWP